jgi:transposase InsO family protein
LTPTFGGGVAMGLGRYVVDAVLLEGRSAGEVAKAHGISRYWLYKLIARFRAGGYDALEPRSRRPRSCAHAVAPELQAAIVRLRGELAAGGHDCGPHTIAHHLRLELGAAPSVATIWRILARHGLITPQPRKRPKSSFIRFEADLPNELWQADSTHWQLADGSGVEVLNCIDDHSRLLVVADAYVTVKAADVVQSLATAWEIHGFPAAFLSDNGAVFSGKSRKGKVLLESELERLGIVAKHSTPYHPQTCGKVERFHQTQKLPRQAGASVDARRPPSPAGRIPDLLQPATPPPRPPRRHTPPRFPRTHQGQAQRCRTTRSLSRPPRPRRQGRLRDPPLSQPAPSHRSRRRLPRPACPPPGGQQERPGHP